MPAEEEAPRAVARPAAQAAFGSWRLSFSMRAPLRGHPDQHAGGDPAAGAPRVWQTWRAGSLAPSGGREPPSAEPRGSRIPPPRFPAAAPGQHAPAVPGEGGGGVRRLSRGDGVHARRRVERVVALGGLSLAEGGAADPGPRPRTKTACWGGSAGRDARCRCRSRPRPRPSSLDSRLPSWWGSRWRCSRT